MAFSAAGAVLVAFAALLALPLQAQALTTFVSNAGQTSNFTLTIGKTSSLSFSRAQQFTTGDSEGGYTLSEVVSKLSDAGINATPLVSIYSDASNNVGSSLYVLTNPTWFSFGSNTFTAPMNATLAKETKYWVVFENTATGTTDEDQYRIQIEDTGNEDDGGASGWSITDTHNYINQSGGTWNPRSDAMLIAIKGTPNTPATGKPTISGPAQVGEVLTADPSGITDADGLTTATYTYQWLRVDSDGVSNETNIGTNAATYTPVAADVGKKVKVQVSFTDDVGTAEGPLTSDAYPSSGTITAATLPELSFASANITVNETAGTATLTVELDPASTETVTVDYTTSDENARAGVDYTATSGMLTFAANETSKTISVPILDDAAYDPTQRFRVTLNYASGATLPTFPWAFVNITNDDAVPTASIANITVGEGAGTLTLTLELDRLSNRDISYSTVTASVSGTATVTDDYVAFLQGGSKNFTVTAGNLSKTFNITIVDDSLDETDETIVIVWNKFPNSDAAPASITFTGTITDNDTAGVTISRTALTVTEQNTTGDTYTVVLNSQPTANVTVTVAGYAGTDVTPAPTTLTFTSTTWETPQTVTAKAGNDTNTANETVSLTHSAASTDPDYIGITIAGVTVTVNDNDGSNEAPVFTGGTTQTRTLVETVGDATAATAAAIGGPFAATDANNDTLTYSLGGTDADKFDFVTTSTSCQIRTKAGERYDYEAKPSYSVTVTVNDGTVSVSAAVTINIANNRNERPLAPAAPTVTATSGSTTSLDVSWVAPNNTGRPTITGYDLHYRAGTSGGWTDGPQDVSGTSEILAGLTAGTAYEVQVRAVNTDGAGSWSGAGDGDTTPATPMVRFRASAYTAIKGLAGVVVTVQLDPAASSAVTVPVTATPQGGASSADYTGVPRSVTFAAGETARTFTVTAMNDSVDDNGESVLLGFGRLPSGVLLGSPSTATVALVQDADESTWYVWFGASAYTVTEGGTARVTLHLNAPWKPDRNEALTVPLFDPQHEGGASADDYSGVPASVTFQRGQTQTSFTVRATDDSDDDDGESVVLHFRRLFPDDLEVGRYGARSTTLHIADTDGDTAVTVSFEAANYTAAEGGATATVRVLLDAAPGRAVTIPLTPSLRGATAGDYAGLPESVTFGASDTVQSFTLTATDDSDDDDRESVAIGFGSLPARVSAGSPSEAVVQLTDNDHAVSRLVVRFDARAGSVRAGVEEGGGYRLGVRLSGTPGQTLTIPLTYTYLGGATAADFSGLPSNVTFGTNATSAGVTIRPVDDFDDDPGEGIRVSFGTLPAGVSVGASGRSTIIPVIDNDAVPGLSVADASAREWPNPLPCLIFVVTMDRMDVDHEVRVDYATRSGTAVAGQDFTPIAGTLVFRANESRRRTASKSLCVKVLDDSHDEGVEEMTLVLSNPVRAYLADGTATGSISNSDPMPRAMMARFGRTAALHVVEQVEQRLVERRETGFRGRFRGRDLEELRPGRVRDRARGLLRQLGASARGDHPAGAAVPDPMYGDPAAERASSGIPALGSGAKLAAGVLGLGSGDALTGSAFALNREMSRGGFLSVWGRSAQSRFRGQQGALSLDGDVRTSMLGVEYARGPLVVGMSLSHSRSLGGYKGVDGGQVLSSVTGLYPWLGYKATDRITLWGVTGYGLGSLSLTPQIGVAPTTMGLALKSGLSMAMVAAGTRGKLIGAGGRHGFRLAFKADALWVDTSTDDVNGPAGSLAGTDAAVTRLRTALEGSRGFSFGNGLSLVPGVEVGIRHDGGDAERGSGVDIGGELLVSSPAMGLSAEVRMRTLLVHNAEGFRDWGVSVSLSFDPMPSTPLGFKARVLPSWGGREQGGAEALWRGGPVSVLAARGGHVFGGRVLTNLGYGMALGDRLIGTPRIGFSTSAAAREYRLGYSIGVLRGEGLEFEFGIDAERRERMNLRNSLNSTERALVARATVRW